MNFLFEECLCPISFRRNGLKLNCTDSFKINSTCTITCSITCSASLLVPQKETSVTCRKSGSLNFGEYSLSPEKIQCIPTALFCCRRRPCSQACTLYKQKVSKPSVCCLRRGLVWSSL